MTLAAGTFCILKFSFTGGLRPSGALFGISTGVGAVALSTDVAFVSGDGHVQQLFSVDDAALEAVVATVVPHFSNGQKVRHEKGFWGYVVAQYTQGAADMVSVLLQNQGAGQGTLNSMWTDTFDRWTDAS